MSGFLSKSKQRLEHTSKLSVGEFKTLQSLLGQEKNLLNSHVRVANDLRKSAHALDEWAQTEGPDLAVSLRYLRLSTWRPCYCIVHQQILTFHA